MTFFGVKKNLPPLRNRNKLSLRIDTSLAQLSLASFESYELSASQTQDDKRSPRFPDLPSPEIGRTSHRRRTPPTDPVIPAAGSPATDETAAEATWGGNNDMDKTPGTPALSPMQERPFRGAPVLLPGQEWLFSPPPGLPHPPLYKKEANFSGGALSPGPPPGLPHPPQYQKADLASLHSERGATSSYTLCSLETPPPILPKGPTPPGLGDSAVDDLRGVDLPADNEPFSLPLLNWEAGDGPSAKARICRWLHSLLAPVESPVWQDNFAFTPEVSPSPSPVENGFPRYEACSSSESSLELSDEGLLLELGIIPDPQLTRDGIAKELGLNFDYTGTYAEFRANLNLPLHPDLDNDNSDCTSPETSPRLDGGQILLDVPRLPENDHIREGIAANISRRRTPPSVTFEPHSSPYHSPMPIPATQSSSSVNRILLEIERLPRGHHLMVVSEPTPASAPYPLPRPSTTIPPADQALNPSTNLFKMPEGHTQVREGLMERMRMRTLRSEEVRAG